MERKAQSPKSFTAVLILSILLGGLGFDRFYAGKIGTGILKLITIGFFGIWWIIDIILILTGNLKTETDSSFLIGTTGSAVSIRPIPPTQTTTNNTPPVRTPPPLAPAPPHTAHPNNDE